MKCEVCGKTFKSKRGLAIHQGKMHKKDKPLLVKILDTVERLATLLERQSQSQPLWNTKETTVYGDIPALECKRSKEQILMDELREVLKQREKWE